MLPFSMRASTTLTGEQVMKFGSVAALLVVLIAGFSLGRALDAFAQAAPDGTVVQGGITQGPSQGSGNGQFPFGRGGGGLSPSGLGALGLPTPIPTPTPAPVDTTATNDVLHPQQPFATAQCQDGWFSFSQVREHVCGGHGGVIIWIVQPGDLDGLFYQRSQEAAEKAARTRAALAAAQITAETNFVAAIAQSPTPTAATPSPTPAPR
jgi:hypothetical protein